MLLTPHILAGATVAAKTQNPLLGIFLAFFSHYLLDTLPHTEYSIGCIKEKRWKKSCPDFLKVFFDAAAALTIIYLLTDNNLLAYLGAFAAMVPDGLTFFNIVLPKNKLLKSHFYFHNKINEISEKRKIPVFWGIFSQLTVIFLAIYFLR